MDNKTLRAKLTEEQQRNSALRETVNGLTRKNRELRDRLTLLEWRRARPWWKRLVKP